MYEYTRGGSMIKNMLIIFVAFVLLASSIYATRVYAYEKPTVLAGDGKAIVVTYCYGDAIYGYTANVYLIDLTSGSVQHGPINSGDKLGSYYITDVQCGVNKKSSYIEFE